MERAASKFRISKAVGVEERRACCEGDQVSNLCTQLKWNPTKMEPDAAHAVWDGNEYGAEMAHEQYLILRHDDEWKINWGYRELTG